MHLWGSASSEVMAPFHTNTDPDDPVYHDNSDCVYGQEIKRDGNGIPGKDGRRQCDWCTRQAPPTPVSR